MATTSTQAPNLFDVQKLVANITGGRTTKLTEAGIGLMMARALALNGAHKFSIIGRRKEVLEAAANSVLTNNIIPIVGDVTSKNSLSAAISTITLETGYINVLIANSGILGLQAVTPATTSSSIADFQKA